MCSRIRKLKNTRTNYNKIKFLRNFRSTKSGDTDIAAFFAASGKFFSNYLLDDHANSVTQTYLDIT